MKMVNPGNVVDGVASVITVNTSHGMAPVITADTSSCPVVVGDGMVPVITVDTVLVHPCL